MLGSESNFNRRVQKRKSEVERTFQPHNENDTFFSTLHFNYLFEIAQIFDKGLRNSQFLFYHGAPRSLLVSDPFPKFARLHVLYQLFYSPGQVLKLLC